MDKEIFTNKEIFTKQNNKSNKNNQDNEENSSCSDVDSYEYEQNTFCNRSLLLRSLYDNQQSVFFLQYDFPSCKVKKDTTRTKEVIWRQKNQKYQIHYKAYKNLPDCITTPFKINGAIRTKSFAKANIIWKLLKLEKMVILLGKLNKYQRYNHFPCTWDLGRKDNMYNNYCRLLSVFPEDYNYIPDTFILPRDHEKFMTIAKSTSEEGQKWILKPVASSRGRGIRLVSNLETIPSKCLISRYIGLPHVINNKKYDLRLYVLITSFTPLKIYLYEEGLVRFASEEYNPEEKNKHNKYMHLTNYSINKSSQNFNKNMSTDNECVGSKWTLSALKTYFIQNKLNFEITEKEIKDIIIKSVITIADDTISAVKKYCKHPNNLYELYGFDILIDSELKPWLIEVNLNASLNCDSELDRKIKTCLITDIFTTIGLVPYSHLNDFKTGKVGKEKKTPRCIEDKYVNGIQVNCNHNNHKENESNKNDVNISTITNSTTYNNNSNNNNNDIIMGNSTSNSNNLFGLSNNPNGVNLIDSDNKQNIINYLSKNKDNKDNNDSKDNKTKELEKISSNSSCEEIIIDSYNSQNMDNDLLKQYKYSDEETEMILYSEDEFSRSGGFNLIFPLKENVNYYSKFIFTPENENLALWNWIRNRNEEKLLQNGRNRKINKLFSEKLYKV